MRYLLDSDGNVFKAHVISGLPEGFTDITDGLNIDENAQGLDSQYIEAELVAEVPAILAVDEHWTNGVETVYDANDIPVIDDEQGNPILDPEYAHIAAVEAQDAIPAFYRLNKKNGADQAIRQAKMDTLLAPRENLLREADIEINKLEDTGSDTSAWRTYRQALRDITEPYKKVDGDWKVAVDSLESLDWPVKP